ncbi:hypothetical protein MHYP_G00123760 [Metynnis hypsauchen]
MKPCNDHTQSSDLPRDKAKNKTSQWWCFKTRMPFSTLHQSWHFHRDDLNRGTRGCNWDKLKNSRSPHSAWKERRFLLGSF